MSIRPVTILILLITSVFAQKNGPKIQVNKHLPDPFKLQKRTVYPWKKNITATVFWIGETPTPRNPTPNHKSSWDQKWQQNYGGFDNPDPKARSGYLPKAFTPKLNPFYIALPYNDCINHKHHKPEASRVIPWWKRTVVTPGKSVCKGRWVQIYCPKTKKICYAQWEDCGPFTTTDFNYVFGKSRPKNKKNQGAGIDLSPAVRDYLKIGNKAVVHWRFIEMSRIPAGPWTKLGTNNPFVNKKVDYDRAERRRYIKYLEHLHEIQRRNKRRQ